MSKFDLSRIVGSADVSDSDTELREIPLDKIRENSENFYPPLPEDEAEALRESIQANGLLEPLLVVADGATYRLVSGHNRLRALRDLRANALGMEYKTALCRVLPAHRGPPWKPAECGCRAGIFPAGILPFSRM